MSGPFVVRRRRPDPPWRQAPPPKPETPLETIRDDLRSEIEALSAVLPAAGTRETPELNEDAARRLIGGFRAVSGAAGKAGHEVWFAALPAAAVRWAVEQGWEDVLPLLGETPRLDRLDLRGAGIERLNLLHCDLRKAQLEGVVAEGADLRNTILFEAGLEEACLRRVSLDGAEMDRASARKADLSFSRLDFAQAGETDFRGANLTYARFSRATLGASSRYSRRIGRKLELAAANFERARLLGANLEAAWCFQCNFSHASCNGALFRGAALREANFKFANLQGADFTGADLRGANLERATLSSANLAGADLRNARNLPLDRLREARRWREALYDPHTAKQLGLAAAAAAGPEFFLA